IRPARAKALIIRYLYFTICDYLLLPLQGAASLCMNPGVPLRSAPGYALVAFSRRIHPTVRTIMQFDFVD
ncbi:hypothetical protein, partial [Xylanibacter rodentium]